jgi:hypothetical protein
MAIHDTVIKMVTRQPKDGVEVDQSVTEKLIKSKAGLVINIFAALLAFNMWFQGSLNSKVMNNTIQANDLWVFYQAKSIKQTSYELAAQEANARGDNKLAEHHHLKALSYDQGAEGKPELFKQAKQLEADRDHYKKQLPWVGYASTAYQLAIVLLSASILSVSMALFWGSFVLAGTGIFLMLQGILLWF